MTLDCRDVERVAGFWSALLDVPCGRRRPAGCARATDGRRAGADFQPVAEPTPGTVRLHLDLQVPDVDAALARVVALGGSDLRERHEDDEGTVVVVADPEGNALCLVAYRAGPA